MLWCCRFWSITFRGWLWQKGRSLLRRGLDLWRNGLVIRDGVKRQHSCMEFTRHIVCLQWVRIWRKASMITSEKKNIAIFILYLIYIIFVYKYERILVGALHMPSISSRRFTFCTTVPVCHHHLLWASRLLPNTKMSNPVSLQEIGVISALCKSE